jgi:hypothetical protein
VGERSRLECGGEVVEVDAEEEPLQSISCWVARNRARIELTRPARTGRAAITAPTKARVMTMGGLVGSLLKVW